MRHGLGTAAASKGLGRDGEADRHMENAGLAIIALSKTFNMGMHAGTASAMLRLWGREDEALEWDQFLAA
jgi:hypothetical protein